MRFVRVFVIAAAVCGPLSACRIFRPERFEAQKRCAARLPILRQAPEREYRRLGIVKDSTDEGLAWQACDLGADAVLLEEGDRVRATRNVKGIAIRWVE